MTSTIEESSPFIISRRGYNISTMSVTLCRINRMDTSNKLSTSSIQLSVVLQHLLSVSCQCTSINTTYAAINHVVEKNLLKRCRHRVRLFYCSMTMGHLVRPASLGGLWMLLGVCGAEAWDTEDETFWRHEGEGDNASTSSNHAWTFSHW